VRIGDRAAKFVTVLGEELGIASPHLLEGCKPSAGPDVPRGAREAGAGVTVLPGGLRLEERTGPKVGEAAECGPLLAGGEVVRELERVLCLLLAHHQGEGGDEVVAHLLQVHGADVNGEVLAAGWERRNRRVGGARAEDLGQRPLRTQPVGEVAAVLGAVLEAHAEVAEGEEDVGAPLEKTALEGDLVWEPLVVAVEERDKRPAGGGEAGVARRPGALVWQAQEADGRPKGFDGLDGVVRRAVVDHDDLVAR
jgi:hypothetical protein